MLRYSDELNAFRRAVDTDVEVGRCQLTEYSDQYKLEVEVPGAAQQDLAVTVSDSDVAVRRNPPGAKPSIGTVLIQDRSLNGFYRQIRLPKTLAPEGHTAQLRNGLLTVTLRKLVRAPQKAIEIT